MMKLKNILFVSLLYIACIHTVSEHDIYKSSLPVPPPLPQKMTAPSNNIPTNDNSDPAAMFARTAPQQNERVVHHHHKVAPQPDNKMLAEFLQVLEHRNKRREDEKKEPLHQDIERVLESQKQQKEIEKPAQPATSPLEEIQQKMSTIRQKNDVDAQERAARVKDKVESNTQQTNDQLHNDTQSNQLLLQNALSKPAHMKLPQKPTQHADAPAVYIPFLLRKTGFALSAATCFACGYAARWYWNEKRQT